VRPLVPRNRIRVVQGYFRQKPKIYAYLQQVPIQRQYDVAYPYGVGGDNLLDQFAGGYNFDNWVTSAIIGYFFNRFVVTPFGIPSVTDLLGQAFTAVTGRSVRGFEDYLQYLSSALSEVFGPDFFQKPENRQRRSMDDIDKAKMFGELKEKAGSLLNTSSLAELFDVDNLQLAESNLPPGSVLSLASVIGMAMIAQYISMGGGRNEKPSKVSFGDKEQISRRGLSVRRPFVRRRRKKYPYFESEKDFPHSGYKTRYLYNHITKQPVKDEPPIIDEYNDDIDFYEDKNYEYIDQDEIDTVKNNFETNRKISEENSENVNKIKFNFKAVDYDNYEYEEIGILDFRKKPPKQVSSFDKRLSKRRFPAARPSAIQLVRRQKKRPIYAYGHINQSKKKVGTSPFLEGLGSRFDFGSMVTIAGFWYIWQAYLSGLVPTSIIQDLANNVGNFGRSADSEAKISQLVNLLKTYQLEQEIHLAGRSQTQ